MGRIQPGIRLLLPAAAMVVVYGHWMDPLLRSGLAPYTCASRRAVELPARVHSPGSDGVGIPASRSSSHVAGTFTLRTLATDGFGQHDDFEPHRPGQNVGPGGQRDSLSISRVYYDPCGLQPSPPASGSGSCAQRSYGRTVYRRDFSCDSFGVASEVRGCSRVRPGDRGRIGGSGLQLLLHAAKMVTESGRKDCAMWMEQAFKACSTPYPWDFWLDRLLFPPPQPEDIDSNQRQQCFRDQNGHEYTFRP